MNYTNKPPDNSYASYFKTYTNLVADVPLDKLLVTETKASLEFWRAIRASETEKGYAPGKWTLKEMLQHIIDTERVFQYRALTFAREESAALPGFNHDEYVVQSEANARAWSSLVEEWHALRLSTQLLFGSFTQEQLAKAGTANNKPFTVAACGYILAGHEKHHRQVAAERYFK
jgi:hypothetical protein